MSRFDFQRQFCCRELFDGNFHKLQIQPQVPLALGEVPPSTHLNQNQIPTKFDNVHGLI